MDRVYILTRGLCTSPFKKRPTVRGLVTRNHKVLLAKKLYYVVAMTSLLFYYRGAEPGHMEFAKRFGGPRVEGVSS